MKVVPVLHIFLARTVLVGEAELHAERHGGKEANTHDVVSEPVIILSRCSGVKPLAAQLLAHRLRCPSR